MDPSQSGSAQLRSDVFAEPLRQTVEQLADVCHLVGRGAGERAAVGAPGGQVAPRFVRQGFLGTTEEPEVDGETRPAARRAQQRDGAAADVRRTVGPGEVQQVRAVGGAEPAGHQSHGLAGHAGRGVREEGAAVLGGAWVGRARQQPAQSADCGGAGAGLPGMQLRTQEVDVVDGAGLAEAGHRRAGDRARP
ncbi:hypothetical protein ACWEOE_29925 [Amycolatopsis sp. NPDC004368]